LILKTERHTPTEQLQPFINDYLFVESHEEAVNSVLPDTSIVMAIRYDGGISMEENGQSRQLPNLVLSGIRRTSRQIHYAERTRNLLIRFNPGGASAFFANPLNELLEQSVPIDCLDNYFSLHHLPEEFAGARDNNARITLLEQTLISSLVKPRLNPLLETAVHKIRSTRGMISIKALAAELYISQDAFEKRFRQAIGTSPKHFCSIVRLRHAISTRSADKSLTDTALSAGYYDQAHFIKDFRGFTGQSPGQFLRSREYW
jgi:AraC-like DNA-binding protein